MYGTMNSHKPEYDVQPAYNESVLPTCPPSYSEAVASASRDEPGIYLMRYPNQPNSQVVVSQAPQAPQVSLACPTYIQSPPVTLSVAVGPKRGILKCPHCQATVRTKTTTEVKRSAHYCCCFLFFFGCFLCSCIPYCLASFKNVHHTCTRCGGFIGTYRP